MKTTDHVEYLLMQGRSPKELVELGFPKSVVTRVRRRLREEKASQCAKAPKGGAEAKSHSHSAVVSATETALPETAALVAAAQELGAHRREVCSHHEAGICTSWKWTRRDEIPQGIGEPVFTEGEKPCWHVKPLPFYCALCMVSLEDSLGEVMDSLEGNPLSNARREITCKGCGSKGFIAVSIKCTKCDREILWGWFPKQ